MTYQNMNDAKHWRDRAAEMRVLSTGMKDFETQLIMTRLADDYDTLADRAEERLVRNESAPSPRRGNG